MQILDDLSSLGVKDIFDIYANLQRTKIDAGIARSTNQINEWRAQAELASAKALADMNAYTQQPFYEGSGLSKQAVMVAVLAVVAVGVIFAVKAK